jgi:hypothetical protein
MYASPGAGLDASIPVITVKLGNNDAMSVVMIDANTGEVAYQDVRPQHQTAVDQLLGSVRIEGADAVDVADLPGAPWPYGATPPTTPRRSWGNITFLEPDPASGIVVWIGMGDGPEGGGSFLEIRSDRSHRFIDAETGQIMVDTEDRVDERDREAFDRFTTSIEVIDR